MGYNGWLEFNGTELVNVSRTVQLADALGIDTVWVREGDVEWIETALGGSDYGDITEAPWYVAGHQPSAEFAGIIPLALTGLGDSTRTSTPVEYVTDGGHAGAARNATLPLVANFVLVASTDAGADYGKRWMDRILRGSTSGARCSGSDLVYFQYEAEDSPKAYLHRVRLTRGSSVTRKRVADCSATWTLTFTLTAADPYEYGEPYEAVTEIGGLDALGPGISSEGSIVLIEETCPVYDYTPIFDPLYPALVPSPTAPDFYPSGWDLAPGDVFQRFWARLNPVQPTSLNVVPTIVLTSDVEARMVRVSIWDALADEETQCEPLFSAIVTYLPPGMEFTIDGERQSSYVWDGASQGVRRTDSLVYGPDAKPVQWTSFNDPSGLLLTLDVLADSTGYEGDGDIRASLTLTAKSD